MKTVAGLIRELQRLDPTHKVVAYEGEFIGLIVVPDEARPLDGQVTVDVSYDDVDEVSA